MQLKEAFFWGASLEIKQPEPDDPNIFIINLLCIALISFGNREDYYVISKVDSKSQLGLFAITNIKTSMVGEK
jgi:hypothetical protein